MQEECPETLAPVDLARAAEFSLGQMRVRPSLREVETGGTVERIEPRVMQALVVLAGAEGAVVTRDDLIARCWNGAVVSEDALNRVIGKLRKLSAMDSHSFEIETIPRVGYRLKAAVDASGADPGAHASPALPESADANTPFAPPANGEAAHSHRGKPNIQALSLIGAALVIAALVAIGVASGRITASTPRISDIQVLTPGPRVETNPVLSPDGKLLVFTGQTPGVWYDETELYLHEIESGEETQLTKTPSYVEDTAAISPDGRLLAYTRSSRKMDGKRPPCGIMLRVLPDGVDRQIGACGSAPYTHRLTWAPDGRSLVFSDQINGVWTIKALKIEDGSVQTLVPPSSTGANDLHATISPDGARVAFVRFESDEDADVFVYELKSGKLSRISTRNTWAQVAWVDPRRLIVFAAAPSRDFIDSWLHDLDGAARLLSPGQAILRRPNVAGDMVALELKIDTRSIISLYAPNTPMQWGFGADDEGAAFSPDGVLAFVHRDSIYAQAPGETPKRVARLEPVAAHSLSWSPDGRRIVYVASAERRQKLHIVDVAAGAVRPLAIQSVEEPGNPTWSVDGRHILFTGNSSKGARLMRVSVEGGAPAPISDYGWEDAIETTQGLFARHSTEAGIWRLAPDTKPERVAPYPPQASYAGLRSFVPWTIADGKVYALSGSHETQKLFAFPLSSGELETIGQVDHNCAGKIAVSPKTGEIICQQWNFGSDIGLMRLNP